MKYRNWILMTIVAMGLPSYLNAEPKYYVVFNSGSSAQVQEPSPDAIINFSNTHCGTAYASIVELQAGGLPCNGVSATAIPPLTVNSLSEKVLLENTMVTDFTGFSSLTSFNGYEMNLKNNSTASFEGFHNIAGNINILRLLGNPNIADLSGFRSLQEVSYHLYIPRTSNITTLSGFDSLEKIGTLNSYRTSLVNFTGTPNLTSIGRITGWENVLLNLDGLENITRITSTFDLSDAPYLSNIDGLIGLTSTAGPVVNKEGLKILNAPLLNDVKGIQNIGYGSINLDLREFATKAPANSAFCLNFDNADMVVNGHDGVGYVAMPKNYVCEL